VGRVIGRCRIAGPTGTVTTREVSCSVDAGSRLASLGSGALTEGDEIDLPVILVAGSWTT